MIIAVPVAGAIVLSVDCSRRTVWPAENESENKTDFASSSVLADALGLAR
jgi:hypothetical protein